MTFQSPFGDTGGAWDALTILASRRGVSEKWTWLDTNVDIDGDASTEWDLKKAGGVDGAVTTDKGYTPAKVSITWLLWKPEHWTTYEAFVANVRPRPGRDPKPTIVVVHPLLQTFSLVMFRLEKLAMPKWKEVDQWEARVELVEYFAEPKPVKPAAAPAVGPSPTPPARGGEYIKQNLEVLSNPRRTKPGTKVKP